MDCSTNSVSSTTSLPEEYVCPISLTMMKNPMRHKVTGHCFERESIMNWLYLGNTACPLTRKPLHTDDLMLDTDLQAKIQEFKIDQELVDESSRHSNDDPFDDSDGDFESTMNDILEITSRIRNITVAQRSSTTEDQSRRQCPLSARPAAPVAPPATTRLSDIRSRVLQRRDARIQNVLTTGKEDPSQVKTNDLTDNMSLAQLMTSRM